MNLLLAKEANLGQNSGQFLVEAAPDSPIFAPYFAYYALLKLRQNKLIYQSLIISVALGQSLVSYWVIFEQQLQIRPIFTPKFRLFLPLAAHTMTTSNLEVELAEVKKFDEWK